MAFSLYYEAKREQPLTEQEKEASKEFYQTSDNGTEGIV